MIAHSSVHRRAAFRLGAALLAAGLLVAACDSKSNNGTGPDPEPEPEPQNRAPVANAGPDQTVSATIAVRLDGTGSSDADGDEITYAWSFTSVPQGSGAALNDAAAAQPTFTPDVAGDYVLQLTVSDGTEESATDAVTITAEDNTASATIGNAGGEIVSTDGNFTLTVPADALSEDTEISITLVRPPQYHQRFAEMEGVALVYAVHPEGLELTTPATVHFTVPEQPMIEGDRVEAPLWLALQLETDAGAPLTAGVPRSPSDVVGGASIIPLPNLENSLEVQPDRVTSGLDVFAEALRLGYMALAYALFTAQDLETQSRLYIAARVPETATVGDPFETAVYFPLNPIADLHIDFRTDGWDVTQENTSEGLNVVGDFNSSFGWVDEQGESVVGSRNEFDCPAPGHFDWATGLEIQWGDDFPDDRRPEPSLILDVTGIGLRISLECLNGPRDPFEDFLAELVEGGSYSVNGGLHYGFRDGVVALSINGVEEGRATGVAAGVVPFGAADMDWDDDGQPDVVFPFTSAGIYEAIAPIVGQSSLSHFDVTVTGITDNLGNTTDGIRVGLTANFAPPKGSSVLQQLEPTRAAVFTQFDDRNVLFLVPDNGNVVVDPNLGTAFYDNGTSIFGTDRPVSVFVGPNGFTASDPMLAVTLPEDQGSNGQVLKLDLVGGTAVPTVVDDVFVTGLPRRIRCIETGLYLCAVSSIGIPPFGFGSVTFFTWDGQDAFSFIVQRLNPAIGIDLIQDGDRVLVASTDGWATYYIEELTTAGEYVTFQSFSVPEGCTGAAHVLFRSTTEVLLSCNASGMVASSVFDAGS